MAFSMLNLTVIHYDWVHKVMCYIVVDNGKISTIKSFISIECNIIQCDYNVGAFKKKW